MQRTRENKAHFQDEKEKLTVLKTYRHKLKLIEVMIY